MPQSTIVNINAARGSRSCTQEPIKQMQMILRSTKGHTVLEITQISQHLFIAAENVPESIILHLRKNKIHKEIDIDFQGLALIQDQICNLVSVVYYGLLVSITSIWVSMLKAYVQSRGRDIF